MAGRTYHGGALYPRQDGHRFLPWPSRRGLGLRRGRLDGGAARVGLLLGPDHVLRRRVHPCLGHASWRRDTRAAHHLGGSAPDQKRSDQRSAFKVMTTLVDLPHNWPSPPDSNCPTASFANKVAPTQLLECVDLTKFLLSLYSP